MTILYSLWLSHPYPVSKGAELPLGSLSIVNGVVSEDKEALSLQVQSLALKSSQTQESCLQFKQLAFPTHLLIKTVISARYGGSCLILVLGRLGQENCCKTKASLDYRDPVSNKQKSNFIQFNLLSVIIPVYL